MYSYGSSSSVMGVKGILISVYESPTNNNRSVDTPMSFTSKLSMHNTTSVGDLLDR